MTEIYDYLRLLFARVGVPYSPATGLPIESQTVSQMADRILALPEGTRLYLLAPIVRGRKGEYRKELAELQKKGFQRAKVDGKFYDIGATPALDKKLKHDIEIVVDRIVVKPDIGNRLPDSIETALNLADGLLVVEFADEKEKDGKQKQIIFSSKFACPVSGFTIPEIEPRLFSFNNPHGACPECDGLGVQNYFDEALVVPDESLTLKKGAVAPWAKSSSPYYLQTLEALARHYKFSMNEPWEDLPKKVREVILHGSGDEVIKFTYDDGMRRYDTKKEFEGVIPNMDRRYGETDSAWIQEELERFQSEAPLRGVQGLSPQAGSPGGQDRRPAYRPGLRTVHPRRRWLVPRHRQETEQATAGNRGAHPEGNPRPPEIPQQCRPGLSHFGARLRHLVGRGKPAHPPRLPDRLGPDRRALCAGRAHRSACISATMPSCWNRSRACATWATP